MGREGGCTTGLSPVADDDETTFQTLSTFLRHRPSHVLMAALARQALAHEEVHGVQLRPLWRTLVAGVNSVARGGRGCGGGGAAVEQSTARRLFRSIDQSVR